MSETIDKEDSYYKDKAKILVTVLYNKGFLSDILAKEALDLLENFIEGAFKTECELAIRKYELVKTERDLKARMK